MTPADGSGFPREATAVRAMPAMRAALLQGGVTIVFFEGAEAPVPQVGRLTSRGAAAGGLISPALTYEDGSIHFGGGPRNATGAKCALSGYGPGWLAAGPLRRAAAGASQIALISRDMLRAAGGFAGRLFGDAHAHVGLAERLERAGFATWCSGALEFWLMDDPPTADTQPHAALVRRIDAALLGRRGRPIRERSA